MEALFVCDGKVLLEKQQLRRNRDCYFTSDPGGFFARTTKSETEAKTIMG